MSNSIDYVTIPIQKEPEKWKVLTESVSLTLPDTVSDEDFSTALESTKHYLATQIGLKIIEAYGMDLAYTTWHDNTYKTRVFTTSAPVGSYQEVDIPIIKEENDG